MYTAQGRIHKSRMLEEHLPLVRRIAIQMLARLPASVELDDLIQAGRIGLLEACARFQEEGATASFETFASPRIRGAILDELRAQDWVPRRVRKSARDVERAIQAAAQRAGRAPTEAEVAAAMKLSLAQYHEELVRIQGCQLVYAEDCRHDEHGSETVFDTSPEAGERAADSDPMALLLSAEFRERLVAAISQLPEREAAILALYYDEELNLREISEVLGVTPSRASQLHNQAVTRLRTMLKDLI